jgi:hypothetical protein
VFSASQSSTLRPAAVHGEVVLEEALEVDPDSAPAPVDSEAQAMDPVVQDLDLEEESALVDLEDRLDMAPVVKEALAPVVKAASEEVRVVTEVVRVDLALVAASAPVDSEAPVVMEDSAPVVQAMAPEAKEDSALAVDSAPVDREVSVRVDSPETKEDSALVDLAMALEAKEDSALVVALAPVDREVLVKVEDSAPEVKGLEDTPAVLPATVAKNLTSNSNPKSSEKFEPK